MLPSPIISGQPLTVLAPMQDVTDLAFMGVIAHYGAPDYYVTEFLRVHAQSRPEKHILRSIDENATGRPLFAQLIGEDISYLSRTVDELLQHPIAGIDLNLGCPAPKVYKKNVGGGLLREPEKIGEILAALRAAVPGLFTVKMRIGFEDTRHYDRILDLINEHRVDLLTVHGRTVKEMYRSEVHYDAIAHAVARVRCPVLANGNITTAAKAAAVVASTRAAGVMLGRHAIRNPWIFRQCREHFAAGNTSLSASVVAGLAEAGPDHSTGVSDPGHTTSENPARPAVAPYLPTPPTLHPSVFRPTLGDVRGYIERLYHATQKADLPEPLHVAKMKKYLNFVGQSVDPTGSFIFDMRRALTEADLFTLCDRHLLTEPDREFSPEPYPGVIARPNCETPTADGCSLDSVTA